METPPKIIRFIDALLLNYPDVDDLVATSFSDEFIRSLAYQPSDMLSNIMIALSRFVCHVQYFSNQAQAEVAKTKRYLEAQKYLAIAKLEKLTDRTSSSIIMGRVYKENPHIKDWEDYLSSWEESAKYYEKMPDRLQEHIQVIKYELKRREAGR